MRIAGQFLAIGFLGLSLVMPALAGGAPMPLRIAEQGVDLRQAAGADPDLSAAIASVRSEIEKSGQARAAVKTAAAFAPENLLGDWEKTVQRREIAAAAAALRKAMPKARGFEALPDKPYVFLTLDKAGLATLEAVPGVVSLTPADWFNWRHDYVQLRGGAPAENPFARQQKLAQRGVPAVGDIAKADPAAHPFHVALLDKKVKTNSRAAFCGGALVSPFFVVTAAHCSDAIVNPRAEVEVLVGTKSLARGGGGRRIGVTRIYLHDGYDPKTLNNNVAVWALAAPVTDIAFARLAQTEPGMQEKKLRGTGWGLPDEPRRTYLQQYDLPLFPAADGKCDFFRGITPQMFCAGVPACREVDGILRCEDLYSCFADFGGPLSADRGEGYTELAGIASQLSCMETLGVYTNVAETGINRFIRNIIDAPRAFEFQAIDYEVNEAARRVTLTVTRSLAAGSATVTVQAVPGTAAARADFKPVTRKLSFKPGVTAVSVPIVIADDRVAEASESFTVTLSGPSAGLTVGPKSTATVTIADND